MGDAERNRRRAAPRTDDLCLDRRAPRRRLRLRARRRLRPEGRHRARRSGVEVACRRGRLRPRRRPRRGRAQSRRRRRLPGRALLLHETHISAPRRTRRPLRARPHDAARPRLRDSRRRRAAHRLRPPLQGRDEWPHEPPLLVVHLARRLELPHPRPRARRPAERTRHRRRDVPRGTRRLVLRLHADRLRPAQPADELGLPAHVGRLQARDHARAVRGDQDAGLLLEERLRALPQAAWLLLPGPAYAVHARRGRARPHPLRPLEGRRAEGERREAARPERDVARRRTLRRRRGPRHRLLRTLRGAYGRRGAAAPRQAPPPLPRPPRARRLRRDARAPGARRRLHDPRTGGRCHGCRPRALLPPLQRGRRLPAVAHRRRRLLRPHVPLPRRPRRRQGRHPGRLHPEGEVHLLARHVLPLDRLRPRRGPRRREHAPQAPLPRQSHRPAPRPRPPLRGRRLHGPHPGLRELHERPARLRDGLGRAERPHLRLAVRQLPAARRERDPRGAGRRRGAAAQPDVARGDGARRGLLRRHRPGALRAHLHDLLRARAPGRLPHHPERPRRRHLHVRRARPLRRRDLDPLEGGLRRVLQHLRQRGPERQAPRERRPQDRERPRAGHGRARRDGDQRRPHEDDVRPREAPPRVLRGGVVRHPVDVPLPHAPRPHHEDQPRAARDERLHHPQRHGVLGLVPAPPPARPRLPPRLPRAEELLEAARRHRRPLRPHGLLLDGRPGLPRGRTPLPRLAGGDLPLRPGGADAREPLGRDPRPPRLHGPRGPQQQPHRPDARLRRQAADRHRHHPAPPVQGGEGAALRV